MERDEHREKAEAFIADTENSYPDGSIKDALSEAMYTFWPCLRAIEGASMNNMLTRFAVWWIKRGRSNYVVLPRNLKRGGDMLVIGGVDTSAERISEHEWRVFSSTPKPFLGVLNGAYLNSNLQNENQS